METMKKTIASGQRARSKCAITAAPQGNLPVPVHSVSAAAHVVSIIEKVIQNPKLNVLKMQAILEMQKDAMRFQAEIAYSQAMNACQKELPQIEAKKENKHTQSKYADLEAIDTIIRPIYTNHGFSLEFDTEHMEGGVNIICWVRHTDGHKERRTLAGNLDLTGSRGTANKTSIQGTGSTVSYLQRYLTKLIFNIVIKGEDTDGNRDSAGEGAADRLNRRMQNETGVIDKTTGEPASPERIKEMANSLAAELREIKTKAKRTAHLNSGLDIIRGLAVIGEETKIQELHALVDKGEA